MIPASHGPEQLVRIRVKYTMKFVSTYEKAKKDAEDASSPFFEKPMFYCNTDSKLWQDMNLGPQLEISTFQCQFIIWPYHDDL